MSSAEGHLRQKADQMDSISKMSVSLTWKVTKTQTDGNEMRRHLREGAEGHGGQRVHFKPEYLHQVKNEEAIL